MLLLLVMCLVSIMMQRHTVELFERIGDLSARCGESRVQRHTFHLARAHAEAFVCAGAVAANVETVRLFDVAEVESIDAAALIGNNRRLGVAKESPRGAAEEWVVLHV